MAYLLLLNTAYRSSDKLRITNVIKGEFKKLEDLNDEDVLLTYGTSLEVKVGNIPCDSNKDDDSEQQVTHEANDDIGYDPSDVAFTEWLRIDNNIYDFETPMCKTFKEFNYFLQIDPDLLTKDIEGFKTYEEYKDDWIYEWNRDIPWVDEKPWTDARVWTEPTPIKHYSLKDSELKEQALRNKAIMEGLISDDESCNDGWRRWESHEITFCDHDEIDYENETHDERQELCETHELPVCNMRRFEMIKY
ncbi:hypothetical protein Tco_0172692 [Tanacetum coccineum]